MKEIISTREEIRLALEEEVKELVRWSASLSEEVFFKSVNNKWSTGEQIEHLRKSSKPLVMALKLPKMVIKLKVGKPNRASRSFSEVQEKYTTKLANQDIGTTPFFPDADLKKTKQEVLEDYELVSAKLGKAITKWREEDLDNYLLPHPLLGKLTVREMLFFTIYHTRHHYDSVRELYA